MWPSASFPSPWPNTISVSNLIYDLNQYLKSRPTGIGFITQFVLTPTTFFVCRYIYSTSSFYHKSTFSVYSRTGFYVPNNNDYILLSASSSAGTLKKSCVLPMEPEKYSWIREQKCGQHGVNIIISDFIDLDECRFCKEVVKINYEFFKNHKSEGS